MPTSILDVLVKILSAVAIAAVSAWITVHLSRHKFRSERWWERKVEGYERVIEAFHKSKKFCSEHMAAEYKGREVSEERNNELGKLLHEGREEILRASDVGSFVLSEQALAVLVRYKVESERISNEQSWYEYLEEDLAITDRCMKEFISEARADLQQ